MNIFRVFYDELYYPLSLGKNYPINPFKVFRKLLKSQYWSIEDIQHYQNNRIDEILKYAKQNIPYYKQIIDDKSQYSIDDLRKIPELTKESLKKYPDKLYRECSEKEYRHVTSGSTGDPLTVIADGVSEAQRLAQRLRFYNWWGIKPSDKNVLIWGETEEVSKKDMGMITKLKKKIFRNSYFINVFHLNKQSIIDYYNDLLRFKPSFIRGYKSAIYQFAQLVDQQGLDISKFKLKAVITTSEILFPEERKYIEDIFKARVADEYGAAEIGLFAYECPNGRQHICEELNYIYTNEQNEIIVTDLHNKTMPIINYKIGDRIQIDDKLCSCGRTSRIIKSIEGRLHSDIKKENGEIISQYLFYYAVKDLDNMGISNSILKYKVIQNEMHFDFYITKGQNFSERATNYLEDRMKRDIGSNLTVDFHFVDEIPLDKSGKLQFFKRIN